MSKTVVIAKCVVCGYKREIGPGEVEKDDLPMCPKCYSPMIAERAEIKK